MYKSNKKKLMEMLCTELMCLHVGNNKERPDPTKRVEFLDQLRRFGSPRVRMAGGLFC